MSRAVSTAKERRLIWLLVAAGACIVVLLLAAFARPGETDTRESGQATFRDAEAQGGQETTPQLPDLSRRVEGDPASIGAVDAPVVLIEYADYRCPYCGVFAVDTLPLLVDEYVSAGLLRVEWRDMPIFGEESTAAALAVRAAGDQGLFWEFSEAIFGYDGGGKQDLPQARLVQIAQEIGVPDIAAFETAMQDPKHAQIVQADRQEAEMLGVQSTPTFIIGQTPLMGAQPIEVFRQAIDAELERAQQ